jgi:hypothetical protein
VSAEPPRSAAAARGDDTRGAAPTSSSPYAPHVASYAPSYVLWVAAFIVHRAVLVFLGFDGVYFWEETYRLLIAEALRGGWPIPLHDLQADPYNGGSLVFSALTAAAAPIAGASIATLKLVAVAWNALGLWMWLVVANRIGGRATAHALGLLWLFAPPVFLVFNVVGLGSHSDTITLAGLQWLLLLRLIDDPDRRPARVIAWAAAGGFAAWFGYASIISFGVGAAYAVAAGALPLRRWPQAAAAFAAGFLPWMMRAAVAGGALDVLAQTFAPGTGQARGYFATLFDLVVHGVPAALYFRDIGIPGDVKLSRDVFSYAYLAVYAVAWLSLVASLSSAARSTSTGSAPGARIAAALRRFPELPLLAVFPVFIATIAASTLELNDYGFVRWLTFRILVPALPSIFFAIALWTARAHAGVRSIALGVCVACGVVATGQILFDGHDVRALREAEARQDGAEAYGHLVVFKHGVDPVFAARVEALPPELRERAYRGIGFSFAWLYGTRRAGVPASGLTKALLSVEPSRRAAAIEGARMALTTGLAQVAPLPPAPRRDELAAAIDLAEREPVPASENHDRARIAERRKSRA